MRVFVYIYVDNISQLCYIENVLMANFDEDVFISLVFV